MMGDTIRQGPHQVAQKSTTTGLLPLFRLERFSFVIVTSIRFQIYNLTIYYLFLNDPIYKFRAKSFLLPFATHLLIDLIVEHIVTLDVVDKGMAHVYPALLAVKQHMVLALRVA